MADFFYVIRSRVDGSYLVAHPHTEDKNKSYLLIFQQDFEALSYLNAHAKDVAVKFGVESVVSSQLKAMLQRWGFSGVGMVRDPLLPRVEFLVVE